MLLTCCIHVYFLEDQCGCLDQFDLAFISVCISFLDYWVPPVKWSSLGSFNNSHFLVIWQWFLIYYWYLTFIKWCPYPFDIISQCTSPLTSILYAISGCIIQHHGERQGRFPHSQSHCQPHQSQRIAKTPMVLPNVWEAMSRRGWLFCLGRLTTGRHKPICVYQILLQVVWEFCFMNFLFFSFRMGSNVTWRQNPIRGNSCYLLITQTNMLVDSPSMCSLVFFCWSS